VIILSLVLMLAAEIVNIVGYLRKDYRTIIGAVLSIVSGELAPLCTSDVNPLGNDPDRGTHPPKFELGWGTPIALWRRVHARGTCP